MSESPRRFASMAWWWLASPVSRQSAPCAMASSKRLPPAPLMTASRRTTLPVSANLTCTAGPLNGWLQRAASSFCAFFASSGTVMGSMLPTRPQPSANASISRIPKNPASTSLTPPSAASRFVCIQIAEMPLFTSWKATSCPLSFLRGEKMTGWWDTMSPQPFRAASSTTSGVMSSVTSTQDTSPPQSTSRPGLSQLSARASGAMRCISSYICCTVVMLCSPLLSVHPSLSPALCRPAHRGGGEAAWLSAMRRSLPPPATGR